MTAISSAAIIGSGVAGLAAGIQLAKAGVRVDLYEAKPELALGGSGISLQGNALRVFDSLGVWDEIRAAGFTFEGLNLRAPGPGAPVVAALPDVKSGGPDYPAAMGMPRAELAQILFARAESVGVTVRFGARVTGIEQSEDGAELFVDGEGVGTYDLVIGADGLNSTVRGLIGIDTKPKPNGMGIWRTFVSRPAEVERSELYYGGPVFIAGYCPTGDDTMYAYLVEKAQDRSGVGPDAGATIMREESMGYGGPWNDIRANLGADARVNYTWFTSHLVDGAWNRGRVVLIGDAAHSCPPTVAQGGAQAAEDALVLAELLLAADALTDDLWADFTARRLERVRTIVDASVQLGQWLLDGDRDADVPGLMGKVAALTSAPA